MTTSWHKLISNIKTWKRGGQRAPHKPLLTLLLLSRAQQGLSPDVSYSQIETTLKDALIEFGPSRKSYHPEFPFWHLKSDGFWVVRDAETMDKKNGGYSPPKSVLLSHNAVGEVPDELWQELEDNRSLIVELAQTLLNEFWEPSYHDDIASYFGLDMTVVSQTVLSLIKKRDPGFRREVLRAYEQRCAICDYNGRLGLSPFGLEAAHIKWHSYGGADTVPNGLALCSLHHVAFDRGAIGLRDNLEVIVSQDLVGGETVERDFIDYSGKPLRLPQDPSLIPDKAFIRWHLKNVFKEPARV